MAEPASAVRDDMLRLVFTCCHPALSAEARVALALRTLARLEVAAIARAFLVPEATMAKRLVRARQKIAAAMTPAADAPATVCAQVCWCLGMDAAGLMRSS